MLITKMGGVMSQTRVATKDTSFNHILELARQLELPERARLVAYLAADVELSLFQPPPLAIPTAEKRRKLIERLQQEYGHLLTPSDEFARHKQEEIDREEQQI